MDEQSLARVGKGFIHPNCYEHGFVHLQYVGLWLSQTIASKQPFQLLLFSGGMRTETSDSDFQDAGFSLALFVNSMNVCTRRKVTKGAYLTLLLERGHDGSTLRPACKKKQGLEVGTIPSSTHEERSRRCT